MASAVLLAACVPMPHVLIVCLRVVEGRRLPARGALGPGVQRCIER